MSSYSLSNNKLPPHLLQIIHSMKEILGEQAYDFLLIGASARDLIMDTIYDLGISRSTEDVDFALYVPEWSSYEKVLQKLIGSGLFQPTKATHKLLFKNRYEVDIVPFGDIQNEEGQYTWPPDHIKAMNVAGFREVSAGGIKIQTDETEFRVASIPGICIMKILAWQDRGRWDNRDGKDLGFILANYIEMKYEDLYSLHEDLIQEDDFDRIVTTARIIGRDIFDLLKTNPLALAQIKDILRNETEDEDYSRMALSLKDGGYFSYPIAYKCLDAMIRGIEDEIIRSK